MFVLVREGRRSMKRSVWMVVAQVIAFGLAISSWMLGQQSELKRGTAGNVAVQFAALDTDSPKGVTPAAVAEWARRLATAS